MRTEWMHLNERERGAFSVLTAFLNGRLHVAMITKRGEVYHVISFRKANGREVKSYARNIG